MKKLISQLVLDDTYGNGNQIQSEYNNSYSLELLYPISNFQFEFSVRKTINQRFENKNTHRIGILTSFTIVNFC